MITMDRPVYKPSPDYALRWSAVLADIDESFGEEWSETWRTMTTQMDELEGYADKIPSVLPEEEWPTGDDLLTWDRWEAMRDATAAAAMLDFRAWAPAPEVVAVEQVAGLDASRETVASVVGDDDRVDQTAHLTHADWEEPTGVVPIPDPTETVLATRPADWDMGLDELDDAGLLRPDPYRELTPTALDTAEARRRAATLEPLVATRTRTKPFVPKRPPWHRRLRDRAWLWWQAEILDDQDVRRERGR